MYNGCVGYIIYVRNSGYGDVYELVGPNAPYPLREDVGHARDPSEKMAIIARPISIHCGFMMFGWQS